MFCRTCPRVAGPALRLAGIGLVALGLSPGAAMAKDDNGRSDFGQSNRCSNFQVAS